MEETYSGSSISSLDLYLYVMKSEFEEWKESILSFHLMGPGALTQVDLMAGAFTCWANSPVPDFSAFSATLRNTALPLPPLCNR